jgi:hypothetical protein
MDRWLYLLLLSKATVASPVNLVATSSGSTCLAVLVTLFLISLFLVIIKRLFIKHRRLEHSHLSGSENSLVGDSFTRSAASILPSSIKIDSAKHTAGILVGFLGSPAWETRVKTVTDPSIWKQYKRCSSQRRVVHPQASNIIDAKSMFDSGQSRSISMATCYEVSASYNIRDAKCLLKNMRSSNSHSGTFNTAIPRRLSLPSLSGKEIHDAFHLKRSRSLKCPRLRRSDVSTSSSCSNQSLRLVENTTGPEYLLPLSPTHPHAQFPLPIKSAALSAGDLNSDLHVLPPTPVRVSSSRPFSSPTNTSDRHKRTSAAFHISPPYALITKTDRILPDIPPLVSKVPHSHLKGGNESAPPITSSANSKVACKTPFFRKSLSPVTSSIDVDSSVPLALLPLNPTRSTKIKPKPRSSSVGVRRSPPLGPSPLRTMILPDNSVQSNDIRPGSRDSSVIGRTHYGHLGIGFPTPNTNYEQPNDPPESSHNQQHAKTSATQISDDDPNILLSIIRELVEETSEWDASLFMDDNFKSMIQNSGLLLSEKTRDKYDTENINSKGKTMLPDRSEELDLSLIGVDVFHSDGETFISDHNLAIQEPTRPDMKELVSFWDEGGWGNEPRNNM